MIEDHLVMQPNNNQGGGKTTTGEIKHNRSNCKRKTHHFVDFLMHVCNVFNKYAD